MSDSIFSQLPSATGWNQLLEAANAAASLPAPSESSLPGSPKHALSDDDDDCEETLYENAKRMQTADFAGEPCDYRFLVASVGEKPSGSLLPAETFYCRLAREANAHQLAELQRLRQRQACDLLRTQQLIDAHMDTQMIRRRDTDQLVLEALALTDGAPQPVHRKWQQIAKFRDMLRRYASALDECNAA